MKADHQSKQYRLEDQLLKYFPEEIEKHKGFIKGFESDLEVLAAHPHPEDGFAGMEIRGDLLTDKENAGVTASVPEFTIRTISIEGTMLQISSAISTSRSVAAPKLKPSRQASSTSANTFG